MSKNMSKNTKTNTVKITEENLDKTALEVARSDEKAKKSKTEKLLSLIGGNDKFESVDDSEKRKLLDICIVAINERIAALKTANKALPKGERKPLKESQLWQGLRSLLGLASAMRSRLRTDSEKDAAKAEAAEKAKKAKKAEENEEKSDITSATSLEEGVLCLVEMARKCKVSLASLQDLIARRY